MRDAKKLLFFNREKSPLRIIEAMSNFIFVAVFGMLLSLLVIMACIYYSRISKVTSYPVRISQAEESPASQHQEATDQAQEPARSHDTGDQQQKIDYQRTETIESTPARTIVSYYTKPDVLNVKFLTASINDVPAEMMFDTGASLISVNSQMMGQLKITTPLVKTVSSTAAGPVASFLFMASSVKIGTIELKNVQCAYQPSLSMNLLGGSFLSNFHYSVNEVDHTITFIPNTGNVSITGNSVEAATSGDGYAEINGKRFVYRGGHFAAR